MKAQLVIGSDKAYKLIAFYVKPLGFELIRYRQPVKAMDNIDEVDPDAFIISAEDFPRHWKTIVQFIRSERSKERTTIILIKGANFEYEDAAKASFIGVNGIVTENLDDPEELDRLQAILGRYIPADEQRIARRVRPANWDKLEFLFSLPGSKAIVSGKLETISSTGLSFIPDHPSLIAELKPNELLSDCSLRAGQTILSPVCQVIRQGRSLALKFASFSPAEKEQLDTYLRERPLRERRELKV